MNSTFKNIRTMPPPKNCIVSIWAIIDECRDTGKRELAEWAIKEFGNQIKRIPGKDTYEHELHVRRELLYHLEGWDYEVKKGLMRSECLKTKAT